MRKREMRKLLLEAQKREHLARLENINLRNKLATEIALKLNGRDVYRSTLEQLVLTAVWAGAGLREFDMTTGKHWDDPTNTIRPLGTVNMTVTLK